MAPARSDRPPHGRSDPPPPTNRRSARRLSRACRRPLYRPPECRHIDQPTDRLGSTTRRRTPESQASPQFGPHRHSDRRRRSIQPARSMPSTTRHFDRHRGRTVQLGPPRLLAHSAARPHSPRREPRRGPLRRPPTGEPSPKCVGWRSVRRLPELSSDRPPSVLRRSWPTNRPVSTPAYWVRRPPSWPRAARRRQRATAASLASTAMREPTGRPATNPPASCLFSTMPSADPTGSRLCRPRS